MSDLQSRVTHVDNAVYHGGERAESDIEIICMHATGGDSFASSMEWLNRPNSDHPASYNYGIDRDGSITRMLPVTVIAYAQGDSAWPSPARYPPGNGGKSINHRTLAIAWANKDDGEELSDEQIESGLWLCRFWMERLPLPPSCVIGHYECSPGRKVDPRSAMAMREWRQMLAEVIIQ